MSASTELLDFAANDALAGFRLERLEVYNWGTFHDRVWSIEPDGHNALLTGDIGSGKSTLVDAVTTLLVAPQKVAYNKAAGAENRERTLKSYVLGYYKSERDEAGLSAKPKALRDDRAYSVVLACFHNQGFAQHVTLAQVFWAKEPEGPPARLYVVAEGALSIREDFAGFGPDLSALRKRLRRREPTVELHESFQSYAASFRRRFGIENDQALDLFHQTVSLKSVGNLTEFVRLHMLPPFGVEERIQALLAHYDDLDRAHEAVLRARAQVERLRPLIADCERFGDLAAGVRALRQARDALAPYFARLKAGLLREKAEELKRELAQLSAQLKLFEEARRTQEQRCVELRSAIAENGGRRLEQLDQQIAQAHALVAQRRHRAEAHDALTKACELPAVKDAKGFAANLHATGAALEALSTQLSALGVETSDAEFELRNARREHEELGTELASLRMRRSNLPSRMLALRARLCETLGVPEEELPFVGEVLQVRADEQEWEGAIERVLHGFALSVLVSDEHSAKVARYVDGIHLGERLVYFRIQPTRTPVRQSARPRSLARKLEIKPDCGMADWLEQRLGSQFDYVCCETLDELRREKQGLTRAGQIKGHGDRHEKDDRHRVDDRSRYVLGWSNEAKIAALEHTLAGVEKRAAELGGRLASLQTRGKRLREREAALNQLRLTRDYLEIDWRTPTLEIKNMEDERARVEAASEILPALRAELANAEKAAEEARGVERACDKKISTLEERAHTHAEQLAEAERVVEAAAGRDAESVELLEALRQEAHPDRPLNLVTCQAREGELREHLTARIDADDQKISRLREKIVKAMQEFRHLYPAETREADASVAAAPEYLKLLRALETDDLPRFEARFKKLLNENTLREIANFQSQLHRERQLIGERMDTINGSLRQIDYNEGRYIQLEAMPSPDADVRDFQKQLRACTENTLAADEGEAYSEEKFLEVRRIIERFRGREGLTELDRRWRGKVTDVRNWFVFSASERWREDDAEHEHYSDSGGKSGGQKEKLAYTVLAASLAYQFGLEWGETRSRSFRFVVIDEAFGRGSDESTRYGLNLFAKLNLQLLIVTPLQKIRVIEPYVQAVAYVHNQEGMQSEVRNMTVEELRLERAQREGRS